MNSIKFIALAIGAVALFPAVSFAQNVSGTTQEMNLNSATVGTGNVTVQDIKQSSLNLQGAGYPSTNVQGTAQKVNADTTTIGHGNVDVKKAVQDALNGQQAH
jgi:hypothetical protein